MLDSVTLFRYKVGTVKNCPSGRAPSGVTGPTSFWEMMMPRKAGTGELVLVGGESTQMRKASARNWSKAKEQQFLSILADTCNVSLAAAEAGVSVSQAYRRRKADAAFRGAWACHDVHNGLDADCSLFAGCLQIANPS